MSTINTLPEELLHKILSTIDSVSELAESRLVCKRWDQHAEKIMLSKPITLTSNPQALVLHGHLFTNSSLGRLVRHIHLDPSFQDKSIWLMSALLRIVFTPGPLKLTGVEQQDDVFNVIITSANESDTAFPELLSLPHQPNAFTVAYSDALNTFRHTLTSITIRLNGNNPADSFWDFVDRLDEFTSLKVFDFSARIPTFNDVERILKGCTHLESLSLNPCMTESVNSNSLSTWMKTKVEQVHTLTDLTVIDECYGDLLEYLIFKYPNVKKIDINAERCRFSYNDNSTGFNSNMDRVLKAIKETPEKNVDFIISHSDLYFDIYKYFSASDYTLFLKKAIGEEDLLFGISGL